MAGIYIHIPFCRQKCFYCDFYSIASEKYIDEVISALQAELGLQKNYLGNEIIDSVYFGGGTPSILKVRQVQRLLDKVAEHHTIDPKAEITFEANPDDLTCEYLKELSESPVNRLSIGIQSFSDERLKSLNRRHDSEQAISSVKNAKDAGFNNISIDLMYGMPEMTSAEWKETLIKAFDLKIQHISAYHLTIEPKTVLANNYRKNIFEMPGEEESFRQFTLLIDETIKNGFVHYEISNFGKEGYFSKHNSSYWNQQKYLGIGPSAHSYDLVSRHWNVSDIRTYIDSVNIGEPDHESEELSTIDQYNDYIMTRLRTMWGIDLDKLTKQFGERNKKDCLNRSHKFLSSGSMILEDNRLFLSIEGMFISDAIISELFLDN